MKYLISSVTIGACLLLSSAGDLFAGTMTNNPHPFAPSIGGGQLGTVGSGSGLTNGGTASCAFTTQPSPSGQASNPGTMSPFPTSTSGPNAPPNYAGAGAPQTGRTANNVNANYGAGTTGTPNPHANSQYDNACLRQVP